MLIFGAGIRGSQTTELGAGTRAASGTTWNPALPPTETVWSVKVLALTRMDSTVGSLMANTEKRPHTQNV